MKPTRPQLSACLIVALATSGAATWAESGIAFVRKAESAESSTAYVGTMRAVTLLEDGSHESKLKVWADGRGRFRREYASGPAKGLVVLLTPDTSWRQEPGSDDWLELPGRKQDAPADSGLLGRNYDATNLRGEKVAGLACRVIDLRAKHPGNPRKTLWVEIRTGLALRTDQYNSDGKLISKSYFEELSLRRSEDASLFHPPTGQQTRTTPLTENLRPLDSAAQLARACGHRPDLPRDVPPGYELAGYFARQCRRNVILPALRYFDGLNTLLVFEQAGGNGRRGWGRGRGWQFHGGRQDCQFQESPQQKVVRYTDGKQSYLIVGDHNRDALVKMAESIR
ncbi:MAG: hypothetical protein AUJ96_04455 [Armatimonadetes bacterium CG2_30_66_41]|nr:MAG: hypothetical protein AUJ96_04455 [Armatimonadetes bacterium CG2_30_66_41]PJB74908.1 MAG: hypothetical protein CO096_02795 [Armatimonadetes bacterium CG_4_9_14_3_um_filter_66_14]